MSCTCTWYIFATIRTDVNVHKPRIKLLALIILLYIHVLLRRIYMFSCVIQFALTLLRSASERGVRVYLAGNARQRRSVSFKVHCVPVLLGVYNVRVYLVSFADGDLPLYLVPGPQELVHQRNFPWDRGQSPGLA